MKLVYRMLLLYAAITVVTLVIVGGWLFARFQSDRLASLQEELVHQLQHIDFALTSFMAEAENDIATLAANPLVRTRDDREFTNFLEADPQTFVYRIGEREQSIIELFNTFRLKHPHVNSVYMGRENGSFVRSHPRAQPTQYDPRTRPWYTLARAHPGQVMHTEPYSSVTTADVNIGVVTALVDEAGQVYGVVGADITLVNLTQYLAGLAVGHGGQILLLDGQGTIIASRNDDWRFQPIARLLPPGATTLPARPSGVAPYVAAGAQGQLFYYTSPRLGWQIAIAVPDAQIRREIVQAVTPALGGLLLAALLLSGLTFITLSRAVLSPLLQLLAVTRDIVRTGDLSQRAVVQAQDEIGALAASFNEMLLSIRQTQDALQKERDLAAALGEAAATLTTTLEFEGVLDRILEQVSRVAPNDACNVMLLDEERVRPVRWRGYDRLGAADYLARVEFHLADTPTFKQMAEHKTPLLMRDMAQLPDWRPAAELAWLRSYAGAPIIVRDRVIGFLNIDSATPDFFSARHLDALHTFASYAAMAIENARLYEQVKRDAIELEGRVAAATAELRQRAKELGVLYEVAREIIATPALGAMLQSIVDSAVRLVNADKSLLVLLDVKNERLVEIVGHGYDRARLAAHTFAELQSGLTGWALRERTATLSTDIQNDERNQGIALARARESGDRSAAVAPLLIGDQALGTLTVVNGPEKPPFSPTDLNLVTMLAGQAAVAIQKAQLYEAAQAADRLKSAFLASMSHELRTPLNSIIGFTGILLQGLVGPLNAEQQKQLGMVMHSARHLLALINDVLDISKIEAGELRLAVEPFDMRQVIQRAVQTVAPLADKKGLRLIVEATSEVGRIVGDSRRVEQILLNLLNNAVKFTEKGEVRLRCTIADGQLVASVQDTGIGIRPEDRDKLFKPFRQIDAGIARRHEGTGLGLSICERLATMMGGRIEVESEWGAGSTFTFILPLGVTHETEDSGHRG